jgi:hypothetical protein
MTRRQLLLSAATGAVGLGSAHSLAIADAADAVGSVARRPFRPYTAHSYFKRPATGDAVDVSRTRAFRHFMRTFHDQAGTRHPTISGVGGSDWGMAYAMGSQHDPVWKLTGTMQSECDTLRTRGFHAPAWFGSVLTNTDDSPFCVIDRASGFTVFGAVAGVAGHRLIHVQSAGITHHRSNGLTGVNPHSDDKHNFTGRGRITDAMVIRRDLVEYGIAHHTGLGHVLHMYMTETRSADGFRNPMVSCESGQHGFGAEGERIKIRSHIDLRKRGLSPAGLVIARTLQQHGCYFGDNAGGPSTFKAEQENHHHPVWHGLLRKDSLRGITWDDFVVLASHHHH